MIKRIDTISTKIKSFDLAKINYFKANKKNIYDLFIYINQSHPDLYDYLRARFSAKVSKENLIKEYININGIYHQDYIKLKSELISIENFNFKNENIKYISGSGWNHFIINNTTRGNKKSLKTYITLDYNTFTSKAFKEVLFNLNKNNFQGQIKIPQPETISMFYLQDDNIVIHSYDDINLQLGTQIVISTLQENKVKLGGSSYNSNSTQAQDIIIPYLFKINSSFYNYIKKHYDK